jgi:hypothetical protein
MQRALIVAGLILLAVGLLWPWLSRFPFGRLPGDVRFDRDGFTFYFPLTTGIVISIVASLIIWWLRR